MTIVQGPYPEHLKVLKSTMDSINKNLLPSLQVHIFILVYSLQEILSASRIQPPHQFSNTIQTGKHYIEERAKLCTKKTAISKMKSTHYNQKYFFLHTLFIFRTETDLTRIELRILSTESKIDHLFYSLLKDNYANINTSSEYLINALVLMFHNCFILLNQNSIFVSSLTTSSRLSQDNLLSYTQPRAQRQHINHHSFSCLFQATVYGESDYW